MPANGEVSEGCGREITTHGTIGTTILSTEFFKYIIYNGFGREWYEKAGLVRIGNANRRKERGRVAWVERYRRSVRILDGVFLRGKAC